MMQIIGHRGARALAPQNTLPSIKLALNQKLPMIEFDARLTKDGRVILFHDIVVDRITRGKAHGHAKKISFDRLRRLNVHDGFKDSRLYQVPTLEEALNLVDKHAKRGKRARVNIELKGVGIAGPVAKIVKKYLAKGWQPSDFLISSFRHGELEKFKPLIPEIELAMLLNLAQQITVFNVKAIIRRAKKLGVVAIHPLHYFTSGRLVRLAHENGFDVNVHTVNRPKDIKRMLDIGVDRIFTDDPITAKQVLGQGS